MTLASRKRSLWPFVAHAPEIRLGGGRNVLALAVAFGGEGGGSGVGDPDLDGARAGGARFVAASCSDPLSIFGTPLQGR
jgi:hypothetical protein